MIYLIKVNLCLLVLYGFYRLVLKKETAFRLNRAYLLVGLVLALVIPTLRFNLSQQSVPAALPQIKWKALVTPHDHPLKKKTPKIEVAEKSSPAIQKSEKLTKTTQKTSLTATPEVAQTSRSSVDWFQWLRVIYLIGITFTLGIFMFRLGQILRTIVSTKAMPQKGYKVVYTYGKLPMLSFFNYLFWDNTLKLTSEQKTQIITHETAHIRQWHTLDVLLMEVFCVLFWYNLIIYWWRSALRENHEFLADEAVIRNQNAHSYALLLLNQSLGSLPQYALGNRLVQSQIKKRIHMMTKKTMNRKTYWKYMLFVPLLAILGVGFSQISYGQQPILATGHLLANKVTPQKMVAIQQGKIQKVAESQELTQAKTRIKNAIKRKLYEELQQLHPQMVVDSPITEKKRKMRRIDINRDNDVVINGNRNHRYHRMHSTNDFVYLEATIKGKDYEVRYDKKGNVDRLYVDGKKIKPGKFKKYKSTTQSMWKDWISVKEGLKDLNVSLRGLSKDLRVSLKNLNRDISVDLSGILDGIRIEPFVDFGLDISSEVLRSLGKEMKHLKKDLKRELKDGLNFKELRDALKELRNLKFDFDWDDDDND